MLSLPTEIRVHFDDRALSPLAVLDRIAHFCQNYPATCVVLSGADRNTIETELIAGHIHAAFVHDIQSRDYIITHQIDELRYMAVASPSYLQRQKRPQTLAQLLELNLIETKGARQWLRSAQTLAHEDDEETFAAKQPCLIVPDADAALAAARAGAGVAYVPSRVAASALARGELEEVTLPMGAGLAEEASPLPILFAYRKKNSRPLAESVFLECLMEQSAPQNS